MKAILQTAAGDPENQDRGVVLNLGYSLVVAVADGAGGISGGAQAAAMAIDLIRQNASTLRDAASCVALLRKMDQAITEDAVAGETTCALAVVSDSQVYGTSVGDSGVWVIGQHDIGDLTQAQSRKPFLGSGSALPIPFDHSPKPGELLLLATDGLLKYTSRERIATVCRSHSLSDAPKKLVELVRYPSGALPDDVTVILARMTHSMT
jgi:serine/threonine protein phosphatase PrpC